ncbi:MAG: HPr family phosphocarrier protein [Spirochaetales bacterium]|nr:HPr family phosphocarrier protein [Spirochaetales bacterium]
MTQQTVKVLNRAGIHARPAALIVQTAGKFKAKILFKRENEEINAKSIMGIITLGASYDSEILIEADGPDEAEAVQAMATLFENRFEEQ